MSNGEAKIALHISSISADFLELTWRWLNDPEIKALTDTPDFTREQQFAWFRGLASKTDYLIWGVWIDGAPAGVFGLKNISEGSGEYWGYIGEKEHWGKGVGTWMMSQALALASDIGISRLYLKVLKTNLGAICLYKKMQFNKYDSDERFDWMERAVELSGAGTVATSSGF
jgi:RimJ/RimL family protein N-acetyltransferase